MLAYLQNILNRGFLAWSQWLPFLASCVFVMLLGANLSAGVSPKFRFWFDLNQHFHFLELVILFACTPAIYSRYSNVFSFVAMIYVAEKLLMAKTVVTVGPLLLLSILCVLTCLADRMPWVDDIRFRRSADKLRDFMKFILGMVSISCLLFCMFSLKSFHVWLLQGTGLDIKIFFTFLTLVISLAVWLCVILGFLKVYLLIVLALPSMLSIHYCLELPLSFLTLIFVLTVCISLAETNRRYLVRA